MNRKNGVDSEQMFGKIGKKGRLERLEKRESGESTCLDKMRKWGLKRLEVVGREEVRKGLVIMKRCGETEEGG